MMEERTDFWLSPVFYTQMHTRQIQSIFLAYQPGQVAVCLFCLVFVSRAW